MEVNMGQLFKCPFCDRRYIEKDAVLEHMDSKHHEDLNRIISKTSLF